MKPIMINLGILEIMNKVANHNLKLDYTTLMYYKDKLICELDRFYKYEQMLQANTKMSDDIKNDISKLNSSIEQIETRMSKLAEEQHITPRIMFSDLTRRIRNINRTPMLYKK